MAEDPIIGGPGATQAGEGPGPEAPTNPDRRRGRALPIGEDQATAAEPGRQRPAPPRAAAPIPDAPVIEKGQKLGRYLMLDKLGEGGMGVVHAAYDPELDRKVALKILSARFNASAAGPAQQRLMREAQAMARVSHPNVIAVHDVGTVGDQVFVAMELVDGGTLNRWFKDTQRTWKEILKVFVDAGKGLAAAHTAGLVHRDFKPDNVLIGLDGRVRVTDFGLARLLNGPRQEETPLTPSGDPEAVVSRGLEDSSRMLEAQLTQVGAVMGTPAYMSPEQHLGEVPDARSDQFSFCAALFWALFRKRPFDPQVLAAVAGRTLGGGNTDAGTKVERPNLVRDRQTIPGRGIILDPPREPKVPKYVRRALMRGLAIHPDDRFPSMEALLKTLSYNPRRAQQRYLLAGGAALIATAVVVASQQVASRQQLCSGAERKVAAVWNPQVQQVIGKTFEAVGQGWSTDAVTRIVKEFDGHALKWTRMHTEACEATRIRGEQTDQVMSLRMICLDRKLGEVKALSELIQKGDPKVLERALEATYSLTPVERCADIASLTAAVPRPENPQTLAQVERVEKLLAEVKALFDAGRYKSALEVAQTAVESARPLAYPPVEAEALNWLGWSQVYSGDLKSAEQSLDQAILAAEAGHHDLERLQATSRQIYNVGYKQTRFEDGARWFARAQALLQRLGGNQELEAEVLSYEGGRLTANGRFAEAAERYEKAITVGNEVFSPSHPRRGSFRSNLAAVYGRMGEAKRAVKLSEEALEFLQQTLGPQHPKTGYAHYIVAMQYLELEDWAQAHQHIARALEIRERTLGPTDLLVGETHDIISTLYKEEGRFDEALKHGRLSLEIKLRSLGPDHVDLAYAYENIGQALIGLHQPKEAITLLEKAIRLRERSKLEDSEIAEPRFALAQAVWEDRKDRKKAESLARLAKDSYLQSGDEKRAARVSGWLRRLR
ncbi:MAG: tetratricopeptide repeat protein [Myxococcota bacterium]|nr:tetratricopeptide repeat protein [Myxococcota bacterium]